MPRNHPGNSSLRNRNRITNKTRLKIHHGNIDADSLVDDALVLEPSAFTAGVDAEDANEHHLQAVLSAASQRNQAYSQRSTRGTTEKAAGPTAAFIPVPDSTGVVDNYAELYPPGRWKDPATYVATSTSVEESCTNALANGFTYYMDERDKEWLDKNNEEARGEGTSAQGAVSGSATRASSRSAKAKGKDPENSQPVTVSEDEFELVMGLFEKVTHEKTEFLHHGLETGMAFPAFSEYQETFSSPLPPHTFASFTVPSWISSPALLLRIARAIYPYWKERRVERGGHRIIPTLNGDETDTLNESYICFRRREIKAVRKTRASQVTSSDKLSRLQSEFSIPLELAKSILTRENFKKENAQQAYHVWEKRLALVDLKRKFPSLGDRADEDLLIDKERPVKKQEPSRVLGLKIRTHNDSGLPSARVEIAIRPKERSARIQSEIERELLRQKERDHHWEDLVDNAYQQHPVPFPCRLFKYLPPPEAPAWPKSSPFDTDEERSSAPPRAIRLRFGRGGRLLVDRRNVAPRSISIRKQRLQNPVDVDEMAVDKDEDEDYTRRLTERWRYDVDDYPAIGPQGSDEQDRILVDDYEPKYLRHTMTLLADQDQQSLMTDPTIILSAPDGRQQAIVPFRLGMQQPIMRRDPSGVPRSYPPSVPPMISQAAHQAGVSLSLPLSSTNGTPISLPAQMKKMQPPVGVPHMRISNGGMRPPGLPLVASMSGNAPAPHSSPSHVQATQQHSPPENGPNGINRVAINMPHVDVVKTEVNPNPPMPNGMHNHQMDGSPSSDSNGNVVAQMSTPTRPKSQNQHHINIPTNGYHLTPMNGYAAAMANTTPYLSHPNAQSTGLSMQQVQNLKSAFANMPPSQDLSIQTNGGRSIPSSYMHTVTNGANFNMQLGAGANVNLKLPTARQMQWAASPMQRPTSVVNGMDGVVMNGSISPSPNLAHTVPVRTPSANGSRAGLRGAGVPQGVGHVIGQNGQLGSHSMSPHHQHSPSPMPMSMSQSPPHHSQPPLTMPSPSLQHQQPVGNTQGGY